jgi:C4-type Zn-finger protein
VPKKIRRIKVCPICHSPKIKFSSQFDGWLTPEVYICIECGYRGPIILEVDINEVQDDSTAKK